METINATLAIINIILFIWNIVVAYKLHIRLERLEENNKHHYKNIFKLCKIAKALQTSVYVGKDANLAKTIATEIDIVKRTTMKQGIYVEH